MDGEVIPLVEEKREELARLCVRFDVRRLELFGSATTGAFDPERSDLDFLVTFEDLPEGTYADHYFGLLEALEDLFDRHVDLVMPSAIENPYFRAEIEASRRSTLYPMSGAARD
jgi:hypothetical protein